MIAFAKRNLKIYFRDKASVFFSMLGVFVVIGLYVLFLGDVWTNDLKGIDRARELMDNWVMAGVLAITSVTTTLGMLGTMVKDKAKHISKDFLVTPAKRSQIAGGYFLSAFTVGVIMTLVALVLAEGYIVISGGDLLSAAQMIKVLLLILPTAFLNASMVTFLVSLFQSENAYSTASTLVGTLIGFITGIYLPISMFPAPAQWVIKLFPTSQAATLFRQVMMKEIMADVFEGAPAAYAVEFEEELGVVFHYGDSVLSFTGGLVIILLIAVLFFALSCFMTGRKQKHN